MQASTPPASVGTRIPASRTPFEPLLGGLTTPTQPVRSAPLLAVSAVALAAPSARAINEIQFYDAEIAPVGTFTLQQNLNYVQNGSRTFRQAKQASR